MRLSKPGYYADFVVYPVVLAGLAGGFVWQSPSASRAGAYLLITLAGVGIWTLVEYVLHRGLLHHVPFFVTMHDMHHDNPSALVGSPTWMTVVVAAAMFALLWWATTFDVASGFLLGFLGGYLWYVVVHHAVHHWRLEQGSFFYRAKLRHIHHHYSGDEGNFGVSSGFWDRIFGTAVDYEPRRRAAVAPRSA